MDPTKPLDLLQSPIDVTTTVLKRPTSVGEETALVDRFRGGDSVAFERIVTCHRQRVYRVARRMLGNHQDADEAAQQAFIRAWKSRGRFRGDSSLSTWLTRIVLNVAKSIRSSRRPEEELDGSEQLGDPAESADETIRRRQIRGRVRKAVHRLPPRQREVVTLKVFSEMTYKEVAEVMGLSEGSIKAHLHQAVTNLRRAMVPGGLEKQSGVDR
jgi:RNA polymerase sigma-70 factor (ECF subfamily)